MLRRRPSVSAGWRCLGHLLGWSLVLAALSPSPAAARTWLHVMIVAGEFDGLRQDLERVRDAVEPDPPVTVVLHDPPGRGDTVLYEVHYCPPEDRSDDGCATGGARFWPLTEVDPAWDTEVALDNPKTVAALLVWAQRLYPSERLMLSLKGRSRFGHLLRDGEQGLTAAGLGAALAAAGMRQPAVELLVLASSASASVETVAALEGRAAYLVATQESTGEGTSVYFRLPVWTAMLRDDPLVTPRELARRVAWNYRDPSYASFRAEQSYAVSVLDLSVTSVLRQRLSEETATLRGLGDEGVDLLETAAAGAWHYGADETRVDLEGLLDRLAESSQARGHDPPLGLRSRLALRGMVMESYSTAGLELGGLSVFWPEDPAVQWHLRRAYRERFAPAPQVLGWLPLLKRRLQLARERAGGCRVVPGSAWLVLVLVAASRARRRGAR